MSKQRSRLGRGLSSLLSVSEPELVALPDPAAVNESEGTAAARPVTPRGDSDADQNAGRLFHVELARVRANPSQPRRSFDDAALTGLAESLKASGLLQPIVVRRAGDGYELIAGERRLRAARLAGLDTLPAILRDVDAAGQAELALVENVQRADLNPIERALAYRHLVDRLGVTQEQLARRLGEDRSSIANYLRLLDLCESARRRVTDGTLSLGHAKLLAGVHDLLEQHRLAELAATRPWTVRELETQLQTARHQARPKKQAPNAHIGDLEKRIARDLQMRVQVRQAGKSGRGRLVVHYASLDQFDDLLARLGVKADE